MTAATIAFAGAPLLAHVGPLATHDLIVIIPMAVLSALLLVVMARPRRAPRDRDQQPPHPNLNPDPNRNRDPNRDPDPDPNRDPGRPGRSGPPGHPYPGR